MGVEDYIKEIVELFSSKNSHDYFEEEGVLDIRMAMADDKVLKREVFKYYGSAIKVHKKIMSLMRGEDYAVQ